MITCGWFKTQWELDAMRELFTSLTNSFSHQFLFTLSVSYYSSIKSFLKKLQQWENLMWSGVCACIGVVKSDTESWQSAVSKNLNITTSYPLPHPQTGFQLAKCFSGQQLSCWVRFCWNKQISEGRANKPLSPHVLVWFSFLGGLNSWELRLSTWQTFPRCCRLVVEGFWARFGFCVWFAKFPCSYSENKTDSIG